MSGRGARRRLPALACAIFIAAFALPAAPAQAQFKIGIAGPLSGPDSVFGQQIRDGATQAIAELNAAGGLLKQKVTAVLGDDQADPQRGAEVATRFVRDKIPVVIGPFSSSTAFPASAIYGAAGTLEFLPAATAPKLTDQGFAGLFRLCGREDRQSQTAATYILAHHLTRIAILDDRTANGTALAGSLRTLLEAGGIAGILSQGMGKGTTDMRPIVARLVAAHIELVFWAGAQNDGATLARQLHEAGANVTLMGSTAIASAEFAAQAGASAAAGTLAVFPQDPRLRPEAAALVQSLSAKNIDPGAYTFAAYAAIEILRQAAEAGRSLDPTSLAKTIRSGMVFKTVLGNVSFDASGDLATPGYGLFIWHKGRDGKLSFDEAGHS